MHIQIQCCGIVLMLVLFYFYVRQKRISLYTQKAFWGVFWATFVCVVFDVLSIIVIQHRHEVSEPFAKFVAKTYLITLLAVAISALSYVCVDIYTNLDEYRKEMKKYWVLTILGAIGTYAAVLHYNYSADGAEVLYTYGPSVYVTYGVSLIFFVRVFYLIYKEKAKINPRRREAVCLWLVMWIGASQIQFMYTNLLIVGYAGAIGIMVLYLKLENPETNLDRKTGLFNSNALYQYAKELYAKEEDFSLLVIVFVNNAYKNIRLDRRAAVKMQIIEYLMKIPDAVTFKNAEDEYFVAFTNMGMAEKRIREICERFHDSWDEDKESVVWPHWLYLQHANIVNTAEHLLYLVRYVRQEEKEFFGTDFFNVGQEIVDKMRREHEVERLILEALEQDRVEVFYQPIFSTAEQRITSAEALVRIRDNEGNIVPPGMFIEIAEETGLIMKLGGVVFEKVCRFIKKYPLERYAMQYIEVNLSVIQCAYEHLAHDYIGVMEKYGIDAKYINLEITESASTNAKKTLIKNMEELMEYGVKFSLDDFGTGQSNLNYIVDMPVDIVKFDRTMINSYFENGKAKYVMEAAIHMIHGMNLEIVSEGIETAEQYQTMEDLGISHIQGYYFSKPLPEDEFLMFLEKNIAEVGA
ncbi:MAG: EAL domain-containing protein [Lachnospiraceae bacterium]|nr:EAL domain-containing protein [Lachnospiraceae bacterium]